MVTLLEIGQQSNGENFLYAQIKEMEKYQFAGSAGFQSFWDAYSHIIFFVTYVIPVGVFLLVLVIQKYRMKSEQPRRSPPE